MNCNTTHYRANSSSVPGDPTPPHASYFDANSPAALADLIQRQLPVLPAPSAARDQAGRRHTDGLVRAFAQRLWSVLDAARSDRPLIATSIAPKKTDLQQRAVASWIAQGFDVVSINAADEIQELAHQFPEVAFHPATRDARALAGKPLVPLDDVLAVLRAYNRPLSGIVNSDIVLTALGSRRLADVVRESAGDGLTFVKRMDQDSEDDAGVRYEGGIDAFFFGRGLLFGFPKTPYHLGLPWWDYFFAAYPLLAGYATNELREPVAFHRAHPSFYDIQKHWIPLAIDTLELLSPLFGNKPEICHSSGLDAAVAAARRLTASALPPGELPAALEVAFTQFAHAMVHMIHDGSKRDPSHRSSTHRLPRLARLGVPIIANADWMGGVQLIINLIKALNRLPRDERPSVSLVVRDGHAQAIAAHAEILPIVERVIEVGFQSPVEHGDVVSVGNLADVFQHVDLLFPAHLLAARDLPVASWIPDFQHLRLPDMFHADERAARDNIFRTIADNSELLVLSSHAARRDWERFFPNARPAVHVLPFRSSPDPAWFDLDPATIAAKHGLSEPFVLCSNQFWIHKGHWTAIQALAKLAQRGKPPLIVCTGALTDYRLDNFSEVLRKKLVELGLADRFRILGMVPRAEQIALMRRSLAVLQPSLFEGWSTVVEDARLLGKDIILSDIDVHQEQAPRRGHYFQAGNPDDLARVIERVVPSLRPGPNLPDEQQARAEVDNLVLEYARGVCALAARAADMFPRTAATTTATPHPPVGATMSPPTSTIDLATTAPHRLLAWPRYDRPADLAALFRNFAPSFAKRTDVCVCLRHDPTQDGPVKDAVDLITRELRRVFGDDAAFEILVVDDALDDDGWEKLGRAISAVVMLPWSWEGERQRRLSAVSRPQLSDVAELDAHLAGAPTAAVSPIPAVSVVVPTANDFALLSRALNSLAAQSFRDFEVVIVNDGGPSLESRLEAYASRLTMTYVRQPAARGPGAARNAGVALARGRYVAFLDDDDRYHRDHLQRLFSFLEKKSHKVAYSNATYLLERQAGGAYQTVRPLLTRSHPFDRERLLLANYLPISSLMLERTVAQGAPFDEELTTNEDWDFVRRLAERETFAHLPDVCVEISWRDDGSSILSRRPAASTSEPARPAAEREVMDRAQGMIERGDLDGACQLIIAHLDMALHAPKLVVMLADVFVAQGKTKPATDILEQASLLHPNDVDIAARLTARLSSGRTGPNNRSYT